MDTAYLATGIALIFSVVWLVASHLLCRLFAYETRDHTWLGPELLDDARSLRKAACSRWEAIRSRWPRDINESEDEAA